MHFVQSNLIKSALNLMMDSPVPGEAKPNLAYNLHDRLVAKTIFINWLMIAIPVTFVIMIIVGLYVQSGWTCMVGMFGSIFCILFVAMRLHYNQKNFTRKYRETVVLNLIKSTYPSVNYEPFSFFVPKVMWMSGLLEQVPNICRGDNYFSFSHSDYLAEFANEVCMRQTTRFRMSPKGIPRDSTTNDHLMNGLFYQFTFKSYFKTDIIILKDRARGIMGLFEENPDYLFNSFMHVEISDKEFEKEFEVYAKDPQAAKEMLNPEFIAMLKEIRKYFGCKVQVSCMANQLYVTVNCGVNFFRPGTLLTKSKVNISRIEKEIERQFFVAHNVSELYNRGKLG